MNLHEAVGYGSVIATDDEIGVVFVTWAGGGMMNFWVEEAPGQYRNTDVRTVDSISGNHDNAKEEAKRWIQEAIQGDIEADEVTLVDDGTLDTVVEARGVEVRFSQEEADGYRDEDGELDLERFAEDHLDEITEGVYS